MNSKMDDDKELVSALADGQLGAPDMARGLQALADDPEARLRWRAYHLIGDVLRSPDLAGASPQGHFLDRLSQRLAQEPAPAPAEPEDVLAPLAAGSGRPATPVVPVSPALPRALPATARAANDGRFGWGWKLAAGFASVAALAVGAWVAVGTGTGIDPAQGRLASESMPPRVGMVVTGTDKGPMLRDPALDELLATHRQLGGVTALQAPAAGLHNATFETPAR